MLDKNLPWEKVAEPQPDLSDLFMLWSTAETLYGYRRIIRPSSVSLFDGKVAVKLVDAVRMDGSENYIEHDLESFVAQNKAHRLEKVLTLTPYAPHVADFLDVYHPRINQKYDSAHALAALGCQCGPVKKPVDGSIEVGSSYSNPVTAGDGIIHEVWHQRMHALGIDFETHAGLFFTNSDDELFESPIRKDKPRPMPAVIQAQYSYIGVTEYYKTLIDQLFNSESAISAMPSDTDLNSSSLDSWLRVSAFNVLRIRQGVDTIEQNIKPTQDIGERFMAGYLKYANRVIDEAITQLKNYEKRFGVEYNWGPRV